MGGNTMDLASFHAGNTEESALDSSDQLAVMAVKEAVATGAFRLNFQPTVSLDESDEQYFEVRCGLAFDSDSLPARQLFNIANKQQLGEELDRWIITRVFKLLQLYNQPRLNFSVWIGPASIQNPRFIDWLDSQLCDSATAPGQVIFQISEQDLLPEKHVTVQFCQSLKGMGFSVCLVERNDELSKDALARDLPLNLSGEHSRDLSPDLQQGLLQDLPLDYLKLAPDYIYRIEHESKRRLRLKKRVAALNRRGIRVIAAQLDDILLLPILWKARVDFVQGNCLRAPDQNINTGIPHHQAISLN